MLSLLLCAVHQGEFGCSRIRYRVYFVNTRQTCTFEADEAEMQTIKMTSCSEGSVQVDLPTGRLTVDANVRPLAEYLTLAFAVGVMFVNMQKPSYMLVTAEAYLNKLQFFFH